MDTYNPANQKLIEANNILDRINQITKGKPITKWDIGASCSKDNSVQVDKGEAKQMKGSQRSAITVRVWNQEGIVGITSTSDLSDCGLEKAIYGAYQASLYGNKDEIPSFSPLSKAPLPELNRPIKNSIGITKLLELLKDSENKLLAKHPAIKSVPYNGLAESNYERVYINSDGAIREMERSQATLYLYAKAEETSRKPRSSGSLRLALGIEDLDIEGCIAETAEKTISHLNYQPIDTGNYLVCFKPEAFLDLISAFSNIFNARAILDGVSLSKRDSIGKRISVPSFSLYDNGLNPAYIGASSFDGEGTPTKGICLVDGGEIKNFLHSESTARTFGVNPTGHAGLGAKASVGPDWLEVKRSSKYDLENSKYSLKTTKTTFVLIESLNALHAGVKASQGSFSLPFDGWLVKDGEKISVEAATVAGDIRDLLQQIVDIEQEEITTYHGISPHIWVDNLTITGEA